MLASLVRVVDHAELLSTFLGAALAFNLCHLFKHFCEQLLVGCTVAPPQHGPKKIADLAGYTAVVCLG